MSAVSAASRTPFMLKSSIGKFLFLMSIPTYIFCSKLNVSLSNYIIVSKRLRILKYNLYYTSDKTSLLSEVYQFYAIITEVKAHT
jgi:hypothetical protein